MEYKKFVIIIPSYNNSKWYAKNLGSVFNQAYDRNHFRIIYIDDKSSDSTGILAQQFYEKFGRKLNWTLISNTENKKALRNIHETVINLCDDQEICVFLDGDDAISHNLVLKRLNEIYQDENIWLTWSKYKNLSNGSVGCSADFSKEAYELKDWRKRPWCCSHLHAGYAKLFKQIPINYLQYNNIYAPTAWDCFLYLSSLELAGNHSKHIPEVMYIYNDQNVLSDHRVDLGAQQRLAKYAFEMKPLDPLNKLF